MVNKIKNVLRIIFIVIFFTSVSDTLYSASLNLGMPRAVKRTIEALDQKVKKERHTDPTPIDHIENALILVVTDPANDWDQVYDAPPEGIQPYPPVDVREIYMDIYQGRLYVKFVLGGNIPEKQEIVKTVKTLDDCKIISISWGVCFTDASSWSEIGRTMVGLILKYYDNGVIDIRPCYWANYLSAEHVVKDGVSYEGIYEKEGSGILHTGNGGFGKNYFIISYSLKDDLLGTIKVGQKYHLSGGAEAESDLYHHFSHDSYPAGYILWTAQEIQVQ